MANIYAEYGKMPVLTPQSQPIAGREAEMVVNNAGGYGFALDDWERLHRFLILGSDGTYYVKAPDLTKQNADVVIRCIKADGVRVVREAADVNLNNRAPKVDPQLFVMALALKHGDRETKAAAETALPGMLRIGTHVLHFAAMLNNFGWSRVKRRVIASWFESRDPDALAWQVLKYQSRDKFSQRDLLRLAHPAGPTEAHKAVYRWVCGHSTPEDKEFLPAILKAYLAMQAMTDVSVEKALFGIRAGLPREALPTEALADPAVWRALLPQTPLHALLRNLGVLSSNGVLGREIDFVASRITDPEMLRKARVHPFAILLATLVYRQGHGMLGSKTWPVIQGILSALEDSYDLAFESVEPTNKRILIGIDTSGSMTAPCIGTPIPASTAAGAMAITLARSEPHATVVTFDTAVRTIVPITRRTGIAALDNHHGGGTDLSAPVRWALGESTPPSWLSSRYATDPPQLPAQRAVFDAFVILSDNETWHGGGHCAQWLAEYRRQVNPQAKLVVCAFAANHASVVDTSDPLSFGCAGLDDSLPTLVSEFIR